MNKQFLYMQKLAGLITEAQYKQKVKILNEGTGTYTSKEILTPSEKKAPNPEE